MAATTGADLRVGPADDPDRYWIIAEHGRGGEAVLYRGAVHVASAGQPFAVAVKMLLDTDPKTIEVLANRWRDQKEILQQLGTPGIVRVRDVFVGVPPHYAGQQPPEGQRLYLVMNWVDGENLADWLDANPRATPRQRLRFVAQLAGVVDHLASGANTGRPMVHGDIKPENVIITSDGPVLVDFGLARGVGARPPSRSGTAGYRAPEVESQGEWSPASDRFALGGVAYFLLTGENPPATYNLDTMRAKLAARPDVATDIADQVLAMLAADPAARPESATAWASGLRAVVSTDFADTNVLPPMASTAVTPAVPARKSRGALVAAIIVLVLLLGGGVAAFALAGGHKSKHPAAVALSATSTTLAPDTSTIATDTTTGDTTDTSFSNDTPETDANAIQNPVAGSGTLLSLDNAVTKSDGMTSGSIGINGKTFENAIWADSCCGSVYSEFAAFDLSRQYTTLDARVGVTDDSTEAVPTRIRILVDGKVIFDKSFVLGQSEDVHLNVKGKLRLRVEFSSTDYRSRGGIGDPTVS